ncbi:ArsC family reductase [Morganella psychrotolerans]|uniref:ArsC family reductase n=1 Tax=Morganella psychrotolerans TaxID=368603 RepID=A0A1B8HU48_9GAMM|nr:ArsC family reductase [Morganella psychrotolerans]OBU13390.1 ArsC family reductase [Morganella psychrotolerans]
MKNTPSVYRIFGIKNCDTMKKARAWLDAHGVAYEFHDYRQDGVDAALLTEFIRHIDLTQLLNKRGTTWRQLDKAEQDAATDTIAAIRLMTEKPALIKRPVLVSPDGRYHLGFKADDYQQFCR